MNIQNIINIFAVAGLFGFANTLALEYFSFTKFDKRINDNQKMWMLGFSLLNLLIYQGVKQNFYWTIFWSICVTISVIWLLPKIINLIRNQKGMASISNMHPWDKLWDDMGDEVAVYVFDFDNKFIETGTLSHSTNSQDGNLDVLLTPSDDEKYEPIDFSELMSWLQPKNGFTIALQIYLDTSNKLKYVVFKDIDKPIKRITFLEGEE